MSEWLIWIVIIGVIVFIVRHFVKKFKNKNKVVESKPVEKKEVAPNTEKRVVLDVDESGDDPID